MLNQEEKQNKTKNKPKKHSYSSTKQPCGTLEDTSHIPGKHS